MTITPTDDNNDLFSVIDLYPATILERLHDIDHSTSAWKRENWQLDWARRRIVNEPGSIYDVIDLYVKSKLPEIEEATNTSILSCDTGFWLDDAGFTTDPHLDNDGVFIAMQVYLTEHTDVDMATEFYNNDNTVRFKPEYRLNHGYLMINNPHQRHGMPTPVPNNTYRLSSYTWFYKK